MSGLGAPSVVSMETTTSTSSESERSTSPSGHDESSSPRSPPELIREDLDMNPACIPRRHLSQWNVSLYDQNELFQWHKCLSGLGSFTFCTLQ